MGNMGNQIKALLALRGLKITDWTKRLNYGSHTLSPKFKEGRFTFKEIFVLTELTNTCLCLLNTNSELKDVSEGFMESSLNLKDFVPIVKETGCQVCFVDRNDKAKALIYL